MGRINEIKYINIIENKPYLTKIELSLLLDKDGKNLDKKITQLIKNQILISLKNGFYTSRIFYLQNKPGFAEYIANILYYPSYLSLEYVLSLYNIIPEAIYGYTSITNKTTRRVSNQFGNFIYRNIKIELFSGYQSKNYIEKYQIKIATKNKALFDYLYFQKINSYQDIVDLRLNLDNFKQQDFDEFNQYVQQSKSKKMYKIYKLLLKNNDNRYSENSYS